MKPDDEQAERDDEAQPDQPALELALDDRGPICPDCGSGVRRISYSEFRCVGNAQHELLLDGGELRIKSEIQRFRGPSM